MKATEISSSVESISLNKKGDDTKKLCEIWPTVKMGLQLLQNIIKNPIVKYTIGGIIAAGDAIIGKICADPKN